MPSIVRSFAVASAAVLCVASARGLSAQQASLTEASAQQLRFRSFLIAAYPELEGRALQIAVEPINGASRFFVRDITGVTSILSRERLAHVATGSAVIDNSGAVRRFRAVGTILRRTDNATLAAAVAAAQRDGGSIDAAIETLNPRFGLNAAADVVAHIPLALKKRVGPMQVESVTPRRAVDQDYGFLWDVKVVVTSLSGEQTRAVLTFEPFNGQLVALERQ
jgi:hypothetical protein